MQVNFSSPIATYPGGVFLCVQQYMDLHIALVLLMIIKY